VLSPYLSGRIGSSSRSNIPWIPWQSSAGISVALKREDWTFTDRENLNENIAETEFHI